MNNQNFPNKMLQMIADVLLMLLLIADDF